MVQITNLNKKLKSPDKAILRTAIPSDTTGPNPPADITRNQLRQPKNVADLEDRNPDYKNFYRNSDTFTAPITKGGKSPAEIAQLKLDNLNVIPWGEGFPHPADNLKIRWWMDKYVDASSYEEEIVVNGKIEKVMRERIIPYNSVVGPWSLNKYASRTILNQDANDGATIINPNEANKFPTKGVSV